VARQIGNAVPPLLAARIADVVFSLLAGADVGASREPGPTRESEPARGPRVEERMLQASE
jgi:hypothetical protein